MRILTDAKGGQWLAATTEYERIMATAATKAMRATGRLAEAKARSVVAAAGFSSNVQRTIQALNKPPSEYVLDPRVWLHSTVNYLDVFTKDTTIEPGKARYLWLPLPNVPPNPGSGVKFGGFVKREHMTVSQYIRKVGPLVYMAGSQKNGLPMLGAVVEGPPTKKKPSRARLESTALRRAFGAKMAPTHIVPMFFAVDSITIHKKFDIHITTKAAAKELDRFYAENLVAYEGRR